MLRQSLKAFVCAAALTGAVPALAADAPPPPPAPDMEPIDAPRSGGLASCIYVRADVGGAFHEDPSIYRNSIGASGGTTSGSGSKIEDTVSFEGGIGCQVTEHLRVDFTGGVRLRQSVDDSGGTFDMEMQTYTGFANVYYDITNYGGFTPYVGGGVGLAVHDFTDVDRPIEASKGTETDFAWNVQAGLSYDFTSNAKLNIGYRLSDLGKAKTDGPIPVYVDDLMVHEFRVGLRYQFGGW